MADLSLCDTCHYDGHLASYTMDRSAVATRVLLCIVTVGVSEILRGKDGWFCFFIGSRTHGHQKRGMQKPRIQIDRRSSEQIGSWTPRILSSNRLIRCPGTDRSVHVPALGWLGLLSFKETEYWEFAEVISQLEGQECLAVLWSFYEGIKSGFSILLDMRAALSNPLNKMDSYSLTIMICVVPLILRALKRALTPWFK
jgi:hypothetical protein